MEAFSNVPLRVSKRLLAGRGVLATVKVIFTPFKVPVKVSASEKRTEGFTTGTSVGGSITPVPTEGTVNIGIEIVYVPPVTVNWFTTKGVGLSPVAGKSRLLFPSYQYATYCVFGGSMDELYQIFVCWLNVPALIGTSIQIGSRWAVVCAPKIAEGHEPSLFVGRTKPSRTQPSKGVPFDQAGEPDKTAVLGGVAKISPVLLLG